MIEKFSGGRDDGGFGAFTVGFEALPTGFELGVVTVGDMGGEVKRPAHMRSAASSNEFI